MAEAASAVRPAADTPLARFLVGDGIPPPSLETVRHATLSGVVFDRAPDHPVYAGLRGEVLKITGRHLAFKAALRALLQAWNELGVQPLVFKGFYLSEFVYPSPSQRVYHDADVHIPPDRVAEACTVARRLGWDTVWRVDEPDDPLASRHAGYHGHEAAQLRHRELDLKLDIHRRLVHNSHSRVPWFGVQTRLTAAAEQDATAVDWNGVQLRCLRPVDAVVFGLVLNRCWSPDAWQVKPRDYCDLDALRSKFGLERDAILMRARELGVRRTVEIYLGRCDPFRRRLFLSAPGWKTRWWNALVVTERGPHDLILAGKATVTAVTDAWVGTIMLARTWSLAHHAIRHVRHGGSVPAWTARYPIAAGQQRVVGRRAWTRLVRAVHRHQRLRWVDAAHRPAVAALAGYAWLARRGYPVELVASLDDVSRTAWLRLNGTPVRTQASASPDHEER